MSREKGVTPPNLSQMKKNFFPFLPSHQPFCSRLSFLSASLLLVQLKLLLLLLHLLSFFFWRWESQKLGSDSTSDLFSRYWAHLPKCMILFGRNHLPFSMQLLWEVHTSYLSQLALRPCYWPSIPSRGFLFGVEKAGNWKATFSGYWAHLP